jgi:predicted small secreted protein
MVVVCALLSLLLSGCRLTWEGVSEPVKGREKE